MNAGACLLIFPPCRVITIREVGKEYALEGLYAPPTFAKKPADVVSTVGDLAKCPTGLPLPMRHGAELMQRQANFKFPYEYWELWEAEKEADVARRTGAAPAPYTTIRRC